MRRTRSFCLPTPRRRRSNGAELHQTCKAVESSGLRRSVMQVPGAVLVCRVLRPCAGSAGHARCWLASAGALHTLQHLPAHCGTCHHADGRGQCGRGRAPTWCSVWCGVWRRRHGSRPCTAEGLVWAPSQAAARAARQRLADRGCAAQQVTGRRGLYQGQTVGRAAHSAAQIQPEKH
jgi:hypothetical protein